MVTAFDSRDHLTVTIEGTFDVAVARNRLRQLADRFDLPTVLRARAAAAITTACEAALFKTPHPNSRIELTIQVLQENAKRGIQLVFHAPFRSDDNAEGQLQRACDCLKVEHVSGRDMITMSIWARERDQ